MLKVVVKVAFLQRVAPPRHICVYLNLRIDSFAGETLLGLEHILS